MTHPTEAGGPSGLGTGRMAVVLGLALVVNFGLLLVPMFVGSSSDSAVAANLNANNSVASASPSAIVSAVDATPVQKTTTTPPQDPATQEPVAESPDVITIVGDEPPTQAVTVLPAPGDDVARVESPAPAEIGDNADPVTPASDSSSSSGSNTDQPPAEIVLDIPVDLDSVLPPTPMPDFDPCILEIVNPAETNGPVHFVIEGAVHTLLPGESRQWLALSERTVEFHRGDDFGDTSCQIERGTWRFQITDAGWELVADEHVSLFVLPSRTGFRARPSLRFPFGAWSKPLGEGQGDGEAGREERRRTIDGDADGIEDPQVGRHLHFWIDGPEQHGVTDEAGQQDDRQHQEHARLLDRQGQDDHLHAKYEARHNTDRGPV